MNRKKKKHPATCTAAVAVATTSPFCVVMALPEPPEETVEVEEGAIPELHSVLEGTVASVRPFGAFIRVGKGGPCVPA